MNKICVVTDSSAQFPKPNFQGQKLIHIVPFEIHVNGRVIDPNNDLKANQLPKIATKSEIPRLVAPSAESFQKLFIGLSSYYDMIIAIFLSTELSNCIRNATDACEALKGKINIQIIDSRTTSVGLGLLVQKSIEAALKGENPLQIDRRIRSMIPRLYTLISIPNLSYLHCNGFIDQSQAIISEMLGILPIFTLEEGHITPIEKVKSSRHALGYFQEFLEEFEDLEHIAYIQSAKPNFKDAKIFHENINNHFPMTNFSKHLSNLPLSILFGPKSSSLIVLEKG